MEHGRRIVPASGTVRPSTHANPDLDLDALAPRSRRCSLEAGEIALRWFRSGLEAEDKGGADGYDPVTIADRDIEQPCANGSRPPTPITKWSARRPGPAAHPAATAG